jgi:uncharacterized protein
MDRSGLTRVRRKPDRGRYDRETIYAILDEAVVGHVGFVVDSVPHVTPMVIARWGDELLLHGSTGSRLMRHIEGGGEVCVEVTQVGGLIVSRSLFDSSMNYRSVVVFGLAGPVTNADEKLDALRAIVEHVLPGRWEEARPRSASELRSTSILAVPLAEASAKVRSGPPQDAEVDLNAAAWAGEIPMRVISLPPVRDPLLADGIPVPTSVERFDPSRFTGPGEPA